MQVGLLLKFLEYKHNKMKTKFFTIIVFYVTLIICVFTPQEMFAVAQFQTFSVNPSLNSSCQLNGTFSLSINPSTFTNGNYFVLVINEIEDNNIVQNNNDNIVSIPLDGVLDNEPFIGSAFIGNGNYQFIVQEKTAAGGQTVSQSNIISEIVNSSSCSSAGVNTNLSTSSGSGSTLSQTPEVTQVEIENPISINSIPELIQKVFEGLLKIGIPLLVVMIVYSGWLYLFARGNPGEIKKAHDMFLYTLIGGAILLAAWALAQLIHSTLIDLTASIIIFFV